MVFPNCKKAGISLFTALLVLVIGIHIAEIMYPGYSVSLNYISDLGATCRGAMCKIVQPSAVIFNSSVILSGILILIAACFIYRAFRNLIVPVFLALSGIGAMGIGIFPENTGQIHIIMAIIAFIFAGLSLIAAHSIAMGPIRYLSISLGIFTFMALILFISGHYIGLGPGGMERMIFYPFVLGGLAFSGYLMNSCPNSY
jgi:hypothetical membrane protein